MTGKKSAIISVGCAVPQNVMTNADWEKILDTSDEWITSRTGIKQRHMFPRNAPGTAWELGSEAAQRALAKADVLPQQVDGIICATSTPDTFFPATACKIQHALWAKKGFAFDISAACAGFVYGLTIADAMIRSGQAECIVLVGAEVYSRVIDWNDRGTAILFGDGAGAVVIKAVNETEDRGILATHITGDGSHADILSLKAFGDDRTIKMQGNEVYKHAVRMMTEAAQVTVSKAGITLNDIDFVIPHQANMRIIKAIGEQLKFSSDKVVTNLSRYGNTSSASIPLALEEAMNDGRVKAGTTVAFLALGGGLVSGSCIAKF